LIAPTGNLSISHSSSTTTFTWGATTGANNLFTFVDSDNNTGTGFLVTIDTGSTSTLNPFRVMADTMPAIEVDASGEVGFGGTSTGPKVHIFEATIDTPIFRYETVATNDDPFVEVTQHRAATTDATVTTTATIATAANRTYFVRVKTLARRTGGTGGTADDAAGYWCAATYKTAAAVLTEVAETCTVAQEDQAGWAVSFAPSGTDILVQVTGAADNNITWHSTVETSFVGS
jgi:hypothetical protein